MAGTLLVLGSTRWYNSALDILVVFLSKIKCTYTYIYESDNLILVVFS
jgi:hypothetical protein